MSPNAQGRLQKPSHRIFTLGGTPNPHLRAQFEKIAKNSVFLAPKTLFLKQIFNNNKKLTPLLRKLRLSKKWKGSMAHHDASPVNIFFQRPPLYEMCLPIQATCVSAAHTNTLNHTLHKTVHTRFKADRGRKHFAQKTIYQKKSERNAFKQHSWQKKRTQKAFKCVIFLQTF